MRSARNIFFDLSAQSRIFDAAAFKMRHKNLSQGIKEATLRDRCGGRRRSTNFVGLLYI